MVLTTNGKSIQSDMEFWNNEMNKEAEIASFPYDSSMNAQRTRKITLHRTLSEEMTREFYKMTKNSHLGVFMILISGVKLLLSRYNDLQDVIIGTPALDKKTNTDPVKNLILFRSKITSEMTLREWIITIKETLTNAFRHQQVPISKVMELIGAPYSEENKPLVHTLVLYNNIQSKSNLDIVDSDTVFNFEYVNERICLTLEYEHELYFTQTMEHLLDSLFLYYEAVMHSIEEKLQGIHLLSVQSKDIIFNKFNTPRIEHADGQLTIHELFQKQAMNKPNQAALVFEDQVWTYGELNEQSDRLAKYLIYNHHLKLADKVAVYLERSPLVYVAMLAILKAGATFVLIDPVVPVERVMMILQDAQVNLVLTCSTSIQTLSKITPHDESTQTYISLDTLDIHDIQLPLPRIELKNYSNSELAYIIFTSGTTGKPKGVAVEHKSVVQFLHGIDEIIDSVKPQVALNAATTSFDLFISESLYPLFKGITVVIANQQEHMDSTLLTHMIKKNKIDLMMITPSRLQLLTEHPIGREALSDVKMFLIGGQALKQKYIQELNLLTKALLVNVYGPTETTCLATSSLLSLHKEVNIGKPLANYCCYILDRDHRLQMIGAVGELVIGGEGLARGYINNPELTKEKFIDDPYHEGQRLYRTGDLARWLPNGEIQYIGRLDNQVKIRGYRIEISDVETNILSYPQVRDAVVIVSQDDEENSSLIAYLTSEIELEYAELYAYLKTRIPDYMIPTHIIQIESIPLTVNGKVDTKALEQFNHLKMSDSTYRAPTNEIQQVLVELWEQLLGNKPIGIDDNFFHIGGTSLSGVKMVAMLSDRYNISINDIFAHPTISELSEHVIEQEGYFVKLIDMMKNDVSESKPSPSTDLDLQHYREKVQRYHELDLTGKKNYERILLTGGTGFLGAHILYELLRKTTAEIVILVRGESEEDIKHYFRERIHYYFDDLEVGDWNRIHLILGDLTQPNLGLKHASYNYWAEEVDCIIHTAALSRHYGTANEFQKVNVQGTQAILDFAHRKQMKDVHYISSMSIGTGSNLKILDEFVDDVGPIDDSYKNYFLSSKAEAERLVREGQLQGLNCTIYRLNSLNSNTKTGKLMFQKESNTFISFVNGLNDFGFYPELQTPVLDLTGVDQAAEAIVTLFDRPALHNQNHHIFNPRRISWGKFGREMQSLQPETKLISFETFINAVSERFDHPSTRSEVINIVLNLFLLRTTESLAYQRVCERTEYYLDRLGYKWGEIGNNQISCFLH